MSDENLKLDQEGETYTLWQDGRPVMSWSKEFHNELINHPSIKAAHGKTIELNGTNDER